MSTVFTQIIDGEIPGRFVWKDERAVAFLTIQPLAMGHVLVVPREEHDHWIDLPEDLGAHLFHVAQTVGQAIDEVWHPRRVGLLVEGFEVPHTHLHVWPAESPEQFDLHQAIQDPDPAQMDDAAEKIRAALVRAGHEQAEL